MQRSGESIAEYFGRTQKLTVEEFGMLFPDSLHIKDGAYTHVWNDPHLFTYLTLPENDEALQTLANAVGLTVVAFLSPERNIPFQEIARVSPQILTTKS